MALENSKLAFVGSGIMAEAMIKGLIHQNLIMGRQVIASDPSKERGEYLTSEYGLSFTTDNGEAVQDADLIVLSIKPQVFQQVIHSVGDKAKHASMILSILAGVKIGSIAEGLGNASVVRAMPNTPAQIGQGITVWTATPEVPDAQRQQAKALLGALGEELFMEDEKFLDMATALSGSGPSYVFLFMEALIDAGVHMGFSRRDAEHLVKQTMLGSTLYAMQSSAHPAELRNQVTSPGGTSASALYQLEKGGIRTIVSRAIWAAYERSVELGKGNKDK